MPAKNKRPYPPQRMVQLLADRKAEILAVKGFVDEVDFTRAWEDAWQIMVAERAWPHATVERRAWRKAMLEAMLPEARACFLDAPSGFQRYIGALMEAMDQSSSASRDTVTGELVA